MGKTTFQKNLLQKIELDRLAARVAASIVSGETRKPIDKEAMRSLLESSPYKHRHERDLDLYIKPAGDELQMILVLDNELPIFHSTVEDVVTRRSPRTLEMWKISTIRSILVDSDIKKSTREDSVNAVLADAVARLDLSYTDKDIKDMAREGMAWLAGKESGEVAKILAMFAELLGYKKPPGPFGLAQTICYGVAAPGRGKDTLFGPMVLYRPAVNLLVWVDRTFSSSDREQLEALWEIAAGRTSMQVTGDAVFEKLQADVLEKPRRDLSV